MIVEPGRIHDIFVSVKGDGYRQGWWHRVCAGRGSRDQGSAIMLDSASNCRGVRDVVDVRR